MKRFPDITGFNVRNVPLGLGLAYFVDREIKRLRRNETRKDK